MIKSKSELQGGQIDGGVRNEEQNENEKRKKHASAHGARQSESAKKNFQSGSTRNFSSSRAVKGQRNSNKSAPRIVYWIRGR